MAGMRDYSNAEIDLVRKSFSGRYALRDRCYFEMALQMALRVSEMLSLTGKIAALYVQDFEDGVAVQAVNEIEDLTTGLSRKIWQKLTIVAGQT